MNEFLWGIDLGGTKIEGILLPPMETSSAKIPEPLFRRRIDTEAAGGYRHILEQVRTLVEEMRRVSGARPASIGIGTPGVLDPDLQTMKNCNTTSLNGQPLRRDLEKLLGIPVTLANDANCFALAEARWGIVRQAAPEARMVFGIIMGTGVGGGIVFDGKVWEGRHGIGGEWGHNFLDESGGPCYCGKTGCVETVLSGPALEKYYTGLSGRHLPLRDIARLAGEGQDAEARQCMERLYHFFGKAVSVVTNLLDPDVVVLGGGVGNIPGLYTEGLASLGQYIFNNRVSTRLLKPALGDSAGVFGAAALVG